MTGKFYGIGIGPGDPELVTFRAYHILLEVPVILVPVKSAGGRSMAAEIICRLDPELESKITCMVLPMHRNREQLEESWHRAGVIIRQLLTEGKDCAFVNVGDPLFYGTFVHISKALNEILPGAGIEVIPGISSINAAAARTLTPLATGDETIAILSGNTGEAAIRSALKNFDTVVFLKVSSVFDKLSGILDGMNLTDKGIYVRRCTAPDEEIIFDLNKIKGEKPAYFSLLIVRK
jgi:precorrin-2/cobalt-factor-2 C20-methyltransferase